MRNPGELLAHADPRPDVTQFLGRPLALALGATAGAIGAVYLVLWFLGVPPRWSAAGIITMKTNTALAILLAGGALLLLGTERAGRRLRALGALAGAIVLLIGAATLAERLWTVDLGIDQLIAVEPIGTGNSPYPNRMGIPPAVAFTLLGPGLLALAARRSASRWIAAGVCLAVLMPTVGAVYGVAQLHADAVRGICLSWPTLIALLALALSLWMMDPGDGSTSVLFRHDQGGRLFRRTLLPGVLMPVLFGYVGLLGDRWGLYERYVGIALVAAAMTVALVFLLWRSARWLSTAEAERARTHAALQAANAQLLEEDRRKNEFLGVLSHELRNPLAPVRNSLYILAHIDPSGAQARRAREVIDRQVSHLTKLVDELLDVTRISRGRFELRREALDFAALARRTAEDHLALLQGRGLSLVLELPEDRVPVDGDETRLTQVLGNLLSNAAKFTPAGGRVSLSVRTDRSCVVAHVRDTGPGVPPELHSSIFEPFVQARQTLARSEGGLGLGLALVKTVVALHGGDVSVSSAPGGGADFAITLPLGSASRAAAADDRRRGLDTLRRRRVLVVDDNVDAAQTLAELVAMLGHEVRVAHDGPSALEGATAQRPDLVLCDIGLPGMDGYEVARRLRAAGGASMRIIALSGYAQPDDVARAIQAGFDVHVAKPPDPERLARILA